MRYKFLKQLEENFEINREFSLNSDIYIQNNGLEISITELIKQGYIEEVKEEKEKDIKLTIDTTTKKEVFNIFKKQGYSWITYEYVGNNKANVKFVK